MAAATATNDSKLRILDAAINVIRAKGYDATRVEDVCAAAGLTKGSFFHHFSGKEDMALQAAAYWDAFAGEMFAAAPYREVADPVDRLLAYVAFRKAILVGDVADFSCLVGTMVQEVYATHPAIREACALSISHHVDVVEADIAEAVAKYGSAGDWSPASLARHTHAVIQGAFVMAKASGGAAVAAECLDHLGRYIGLLFRPAEATAEPDAAEEQRPSGTA